MESISNQSWLSSVLSDPRADRLINEKTFRKYGATIETTATIGDTTDSSVRSIMYEVGMRHKTIDGALARPPLGVCRLDCSYPSSSVLIDEFVGLAKKFSNFSGNFTFCNLAGMVERIAKTLAACSVYAGVSTQHMLAGRPLSVYALGTFDGPVSASTTTVFIPRLTDSILTPDVFSVLAHAAAGEGSCVATDTVNVDALTKCPIVPAIYNEALPRACVDALRVLAANMSAAGSGDVFAYAMTRGLHSVCTLVAHCDEGGVMRDLLRTSGFSAPFGGIHYALGPYTPLPALSSSHPSGVAGYVDSLLLMTGALVAHCDPGTIVNSLWMPTVLDGSTNLDEEVECGIAQAPGQHCKSQVQASLARIMSVFADIYCRGLAKLFGFVSLSQLAARHMTGCVPIMDESRHLNYPSVAPFFWVEPTSLIPHDFMGTSAETEGFAAFATKGRSRTLPAWEGIRCVGSMDSTCTSYIARFRGARATPFLAHWSGHKLNGLGCVKIRQMDPNAIVHPGPDSDDPRVYDRIAKGKSISSLLWKRGQDPFCAPSEALNIAGTIGFQVHHITWSENGEPTAEHVPRAREFLDTAVTFHVSAPTGLKAGALGRVDREGARGRTVAMRELSMAITRASIFGAAVKHSMPILTTAPVFDLATPSYQPKAPGPMVVGGVTISTANIARVTPRQDDSVSTKTTELEPVLQHMPLRYPQLPRTGGSGMTGGGTVIQNPIPRGALEPTEPATIPHPELSSSNTTMGAEPVLGIDKDGAQ
jgi:hypothetical protein